MQTGGEAADQVVKMSLEGAEFAIRIAGEGAVRIAAVLASVLREETKTRGRARLNSMLRSGKELKVFTIKNKDLKKFTQEAKKYGVLYNVLADRKTQNPNLPVDIIARAEDAAKINRIMERFHLSSVDAASIAAEAEKSRDRRTARQPKQTSQQPAGQQEKQDQEDLLHVLFDEPEQEEKRNPFMKAAENDLLSELFSDSQRDSTAGEAGKRKVRKPSVRAELREIKIQRKKQEERRTPPPMPKQQINQQTTHKQSVRKPKNRPRGR